MNWYKMASLIDVVQVGSFTGDSMQIYINGRKYQYINVPANFLNDQISAWKRWKNKMAAGKKMSALLKNLEKNLVKKEENRVI